MPMRKKDDIMDEVHDGAITGEERTRIYTTTLIEVLTDIRDTLVVNWATTDRELQKLNSKLATLILGAGTTYGTPTSENNSNPTGTNQT